MGHRRPDQGAGPSPEIAKIRAELERLEAEIAPPNPPLDRPSLAVALARIANLQQRINELESKERDT
jgi:hypothetical protein